MYNGNDRVQQVNTLRELASDIATWSGADDPSMAQKAVNLWLYCDDDPMPEWFGYHDRNLLVQWVREGLTS
ncbi:MAG: hypothetical protein R6X31_10685 [Anaerolineae bacterium]